MSKKRPKNPDKPARGRGRPLKFETLEDLRREHALRHASADEAVRALEPRLPRGTPILRLPFVGPAQPSEIVLALADAWAEHPLALAKG